MAHDLGDLFRAAALLTGSSGTTSDSRPADLKDVLRRRLTDYCGVLGKPAPRDDLSLQTLQSCTSLDALSLLELLHNRLRIPEQENSSTEENAQHTSSNEAASEPLVGTRDLACVRTLLSILFKWGVEPLLQRIVAGIPSTSTSQAISRANIIDLTGLPHEYSTLSSISARLLGMVLPGGAASAIAQSAVIATLLNRYLSDLLIPCIVVGWLPKSLASESMPTANAIRPLILHLVSRLSAAHVISATGIALSRAPSSLPYVRKTCAFILSRQLLRPEGIRGLCESVFGEEDTSGEDVALDKLEHVSRLLGTAPAGLKPQEYMETILPRMLTLLSLDEGALPQAHRRAIAFSLSRMLTNEKNVQIRDTAMGIVFPTLHDPILRGSGTISPTASLKSIQVLLTNTDPSPHLISTLLTPIVPSLYSMHACLEQARVSDPLLRETINGFLSTWGRLVNTDEVIATIWRIISGEGSDWRVDIAGEISRVEKSNPADGTQLSLFTPQSLKEAEAAGDLDVDSNLLGLKPDPVRFVRWLKRLDRVDVSSDLFVRLLEAYRETRSDPEADPAKTLLYLQLVLQMQKQLTSDDTSSILRKPEHILSFIMHALENPPLSEPRPTKKPPSASGLRMEDLRIVEDEDEDELEEDDGDDEEASDQEHGPNDMTSTAVQLLLSVLEANPDLSARTAPVLNDIFSLLEPLSRSPDERLRALVQEARMVMTARLASTSDAAGRPHKSNTSGTTESPHETYQKALKLLQDPLLPVRAHGLLLLRQLVSARKSASGQFTEPALEPALVPGILSIFMHSVQDDDSYMFLNAVQGLSAMVDGFGKDVLRNLVNIYTEGLDGLSASTMSQHDVDVRTRVGEALGQVIRRCGEALPSYATLLIPPLFQVIRASHFPTVLRTSAISLLAQCVKTNALAVLPYAVELADAMIDLLQVESVSAAQRKPPPRSDSEVNAQEGGKEPPQPPQTVTMDSQPTSTNSKFPPLRRAALHFLSLLANACTTRVYEAGSADWLLFPPDLLKRAKTTLGYIAATDADDVVRVMAREAAEGLDQLAEAILGL
ncbi:hypothetical protein BD414DRAFT_519479 [Trametes punicea]|nr:hypothetical protein BD414DRAFT_519479 [Trametes punicea]